MQINSRTKKADANVKEVKRSPYLGRILETWERYLRVTRNTRPIVELIHLFGQHYKCVERHTRLFSFVHKESFVNEKRRARSLNSCYVT